MVVVRKKTSQNSLAQMLTALKRFIQLLENQDEEQAIKSLHTALQDLHANPPKSKKYKTALELILSTFEEEGEGLMAYTYSRKKSGENWGEAEDLYMASTDVLSLTKRLLKSLP